MEGFEGSHGSQDCNPGEGANMSHGTTRARQERSRFQMGLPDQVQSGWQRGMHLKSMTWFEYGIIY